MIVGTMPTFHVKPPCASYKNIYLFINGFFKNILTILLFYVFFMFQRVKQLEEENEMLQGKIQALGESTVSDMLHGIDC